MKDVIWNARKRSAPRTFVGNFSQGSENKYTKTSSENKVQYLLIIHCRHTKMCWERHPEGYLQGTWAVIPLLAKLANIYVITVPVTYWLLTVGKILSVC